MKTKFNIIKNKKNILISLTSLAISGLFLTPLLISNHKPSTINSYTNTNSKEIFNANNVQHQQLDYNNLKLNFINDIKTNKFIKRETKSHRYINKDGYEVGWPILELNDIAIRRGETRDKTTKIIDYELTENITNFLPINSVTELKNKLNIDVKILNGKNKDLILNLQDLFSNDSIYKDNSSRVLSHDFGFFKTGNDVVLNFSNRYEKTIYTKEVSRIYQPPFSGISPGHGPPPSKVKDYHKLFFNDSFFINEVFKSEPRIVYSSPTTTIENINLSKIFKIHLNNGNQFSNNGKVFTQAPKLSIELNDNFLAIVQELNGLYEAYNLLLEYKGKFDQYGDLIFAGNKNEWFNIIIDNIFNKTKTANEIKKDIENTFFNIKPSKPSQTLPIYSKMNDFNLTLPNMFIHSQNSLFNEIWNIQNFAYPYQVIINFFKNYKINAIYQTPQSKNSNTVRTSPIWDGNAFTTIAMEGRSDTNRSYIDIVDFSFEKLNIKDGLNMSVVKPTPNDLAFDVVNYSNVTTDIDSVKYEALFRENAKNYNDFYQDPITFNSRAIEIPFEKYASEIIYPNNVFVDWAFVGTTINKYLFDRQGTKDLFSAVIPITSTIALGGNTSNWKDAYNQFELIDKDGKINFTRNNYDGIFYVIGEINNWKFIDENHNDEMQGDFTKTFREKINANKDIIELKLTDPTQTNGLFLLRVKTNKVSPNPNGRSGTIPSIDKNFNDSWNNTNSNSQNVNGSKNLISDDRANPLLKLNTKTICDAIKLQVNDPNNWVDENIVNESVFDKFVATNKKLNLNKELTLSLPNGYDHLYIIDKELRDTPLDINTIKDPIQNSLAYLWSRSINFSNEQTGVGKIVSRVFDKFVSVQNPDPTSIHGYIDVATYIYSLNSEYQLVDTLIQDNFQITEGTLKITNKTIGRNINSFNYKITIGELANMFSIYKNAPDFQADYNSNYSIINNLLKKNSFEKKETKVGNIIGVAIGVFVASITLTIISYIIVKRRKQKKADYLLK